MRGKYRLEPVSFFRCWYIFFGRTTVFFVFAFGGVPDQFVSSVLRVVMEQVKGAMKKDSRFA